MRHFYRTVTLFSFAALCWGTPTFPQIENISRDEHATLSRRAIDPLLSLAFNSASWIATPGDAPLTIAPATSRAFRRTVPSPQGQTARTAQIAIAADNAYILFVNGAPIGSSSTVGDTWKVAKVYSVSLNATNNVFAVETINNEETGSNPTGLIMAALITFADGTKAAAVTDTSWQASDAVTSNFHLPQTDVSSWPAAAIVAKFGEGIWTNQTSVADPVLSSGSTLTFTRSSWIWLKTSTLVAPTAVPGSLSFRKTYASPPGKVATSATAIITADNSFELYLNGEYIGSSIAATKEIWRFAQRYRDLTLQPNSNLFAVRAINDPDDKTGGDNAAGLLVAIEITFADGTKDLVVSDATWKATEGTVTGFERPATDDSTWKVSVVWGAFGMAPWPTIDISDALPARLAQLSISTPVTSSTSTLAPTSTTRQQTASKVATTTVEDPSATPSTTDSLIPSSAVRMGFPSLTIFITLFLVSFISVSSY